MSILLLWLAISLSLVLIVRADWLLLKQGVPTLGFIVSLMYSLTYGIGWTLWRIDPSSLFGYGTASTLGSLDRMGLIFALGLPSFVSSYSLTKKFVPLRMHLSILDLAERHRHRLQVLSLSLVFLSVVALLGMTTTGVFLRNPEQQQQALHLSWVAKFLVGTGLLSRLAPVGLVLVPFAWVGWSRLQRVFFLLLVTSWTLLVLESASRGQLLALPLYLLIGSVIWRRLSLKRAVILVLLGSLVFLPIAEGIRVNREGELDNPALKKTFQTFQIGKQLLGTSHEFYLLLSEQDCRSDLQGEIAANPYSGQLIQQKQADYPVDSWQRWHHAFLYQNCISRGLTNRGFAEFSRLLFLYVPASIFPSSPTLFDGQELVFQISDTLGLRPGEISQGTLSLFADAWWRWRWIGVGLVSSALGVILSVIQLLLILLIRYQPLAGLLGQLLALSLVGTWINNTTLTMLWFLLWDFPKAWIELIFLSHLLGLRFPRPSP